MINSGTTYWTLQGKKMAGKGNIRYCYCVETKRDGGDQFTGQTLLGALFALHSSSPQDMAMLLDIRTESNLRFSILRLGVEILLGYLNRQNI